METNLTLVADNNNNLEVSEEQLIGITKELVRCMRVFECHGTPARAVWLETLVAECLGKLERAGRLDDMFNLSTQASRLRSITVPRQFLKRRRSKRRAEL